MKCFIWEDVDKCSNNYHSDGGVVVFAESEERARQIASESNGCELRDDEEPDVRDVVGGEEKIYIFPNAGCC